MLLIIQSAPHHLSVQYTHVHVYDVVRSSPVSCFALSTICLLGFDTSGLSCLGGSVVIERQPGKLEIAGSNPVQGRKWLTHQHPYAGDEYRSRQLDFFHFTLLDFFSILNWLTAFPVHCLVHCACMCVSVILCSRRESFSFISAPNMMCLIRSDFFCFRYS